MSMSNEGCLGNSSTNPSAPLNKKIRIELSWQDIYTNFANRYDVLFMERDRKAHFDCVNVVVGTVLLILEEFLKVLDYKTLSSH